VAALIPKAALVGLLRSFRVRVVLLVGLVAAAPPLLSLLAAREEPRLRQWTVAAAQSAAQGESLAAASEGPDWTGTGRGPRRLRLFRVEGAELHPQGEYLAPQNGLQAWLYEQLAGVADLPLDLPTATLPEANPKTSCRRDRGAGWVRCSAQAHGPAGTFQLELLAPVPLASLESPLESTLRLAVISLFMGFVVALWLGWRFVVPLEALGRAVRRGATRAAAGATPEPLGWTRPDELGALARAFDELSLAIASRDAANEAFAADLVHELKNPLAAITLAAEQLENPHDPNTPLSGPRQERLARVLRDASARLDRLSSRFLELARAEAGLRGENREWVDLLPLLSALLSAVEAQYPGLRVQLVPSAPPDPGLAQKATQTGESGETPTWGLLGVPERIETALRNLLQNAAAFARLAHPDSGLVRVSLSAEAHTLRLTIDDDGPGIDPADLPLLGRRFFSRRAGGTGLGLALCKAIAQAHGGDLQFGQTPEGGARVVLRLARSETTIPGSE
jgi:signal transduction histidine kinase